MHVTKLAEVNCEDLFSVDLAKPGQVSSDGCLTMNQQWVEDHACFVHTEPTAIEYIVNIEDEHESKRGSKAAEKARDAAAFGCTRAFCNALRAAGRAGAQRVCFYVW